MVNIHKITALRDFMLTYNFTSRCKVLMMETNYFRALEELNCIEQQDPYRTYYLVEHDKKTYEIRSYYEEEMEES